VLVQSGSVPKAIEFFLDPPADVPRARSKLVEIKCAAVRKSDHRAIIRRAALFFERVRARLLAAIIISCRTWVRRLPGLRHGICGLSSSRDDRSMAGSCLERPVGATTGATGFLRNSVSTPSTKTNDRRSIGRTKIAKGALLVFSGQTGVRSCCATDITNVGAGHSRARYSGLTTEL
jgi:hypothetical protein